eukprot:4352675-Pyramimonas_sp.AAC.1
MYAKQEANVQDLIMHWQDWSPTEGNVPRSMLGTLPFKEKLDDGKCPVVVNGTGGSARYSFYSDEFKDFLKRG